MVTLKEYVAGSLVANAPTWLLNLAFPYLKNVMSEAFMNIILLWVVIAGGTVAGYLVARKTTSKYIKAGMSTGLYSYALCAVFMAVTGMKGGLMEDFELLIGFVIGGAIGARLWETKRARALTSITY